MLRHPLGKFRASNASGSHCQKYLFLFFDGSSEFITIQHQKDFHSCVSDALITIHERMILHQRMRQRRRFFC